MDLERPFPMGIQHFRPPQCPRPGCPSHAALGPPFRFRSRGRFRRACDGRTVHRFHCYVCQRSFSVQTFRVDYRLQRPQLTGPIFDAFVSKVTQRQTARTLSCTRKTVRRRLLLLARHSREFQSAVLERARLRGIVYGRFQLDEQQTFERDRRLQPVTFPVLIHEESRFVLHVEAATLPARGGLRKSDLERKRRFEAKFGVRRSGSRKAVKRCFQELARVRNPGVLSVMVTDQAPHYPGALAETMSGNIVHMRCSGKLKDISSPLWPINHTLAMLRDGLSRLVRKTWGATKERAWLAEHAWIWIAYRNYIRGFTNKHRHRSSAQRAGYVSRAFSKASFFEWRVLPIC
jgi:transposase-like protein